MRIDTPTSPLLLLAGGRSSRSGSPKGLRSHAGQPFLVWQLERFMAAGGRRAVVVLGFGADAYQAVIPTIKDMDIITVVNPAPELGPFGSLQTGFAAAAKTFTDAGACFVLPIDVPAPTQPVWRALIAAMHPGIEVCAPVHQRRGGHPVLLNRTFLNSMARLVAGAPDARLDRQIDWLPPDHVARVPVEDPSIVLNLNTDADWEAWEASR